MRDILQDVLEEMLVNKELGQTSSRFLLHKSEVYQSKNANSLAGVT